MTAFESWILSALLNAVWQLPLLFLAGSAAARVLRPVSPAAEYRAWAVTLLLQSLLPLFSALPLDWLRSLPSWSSIFSAVGSSTTGNVQVSVIAGPGVAGAGFHLASPLLIAAAILYLAFIAFCLARFLWRCLQLRALRAHAGPLPSTSEAALSFRHCQQKFGISGVSLATSSRVFSPVTLGFLRPLVLLPHSALADFSHSELQTALAHECAHLRRGDFLKNLLYELLSIPVSFHPVLWLTRQRLAESREMACDHMAALFAGRIQYARSLLRLASLFVEGTPAPTPHTIGIFHAGTFERRIMRLARKPSTLRTPQRLAIAAACAALAIATCGSALALRMNVNASADHQPTPSSAIHVRSDIMAGQRIGGPVPRYPEAAKKAKIEGKVVLKAIIGKDGTIQDLTVASGPQQLRQSALDAVHQWTYRPYLLNGEPVAVNTTINITYSLGDGKSDAKHPPAPPK